MDAGWIIAIVLAGLLIASGIWIIQLRARLALSGAQVRELRERSERATFRLPDGTRPQRARSAAGRAIRVAVDTATKVRTHGVTGLLASSIEDLTRWAIEDRRSIEDLVASDGTVTIFFSDIEDSTTLNEHHGDDSWLRILNAHDKVVQEAVERNSGHVVKHQGDGFMVAFHDPASALNTAIAVQQEMAKPRRLRKDPIRVRVGIHTGVAVERDGDYFGLNVAKAARVAAQATGGEILASDHVREALGDSDFELGEPRFAELKGLPGEHRLWPVLW